MTTKHLKSLAVAFALLALGVLISFLIENKPQKTETRSFFNFGEDQVASFQVNNFTMGQLFKKDETGAWLVKKVKNELAQNLKKESDLETGEESAEFVPANSAEVSKALTYLIELKNLVPASTRTTDPGLYEINKYSLHLILYDKEGKMLDKIFIGKHGPDPMSSFIKKADSDNVYMTSQDFRLLFFRPFEDWLAKEK